jgi:hypothetical protein
MKDDLWLAVGEQTGNWDNLNADDPFLGVSLVMAKVSDWKLAFAETMNEQNVLERMKNPLPNLPEHFASNTHHVKNALDYFKTQSVRGIWSLDNKMANAKSPLACLKNELSIDLAWLAKHANLMTLGTYGTAGWVKNHLMADSFDTFQLLGRAYGLLMTLLIPFFKKEDNVLIALPSSSKAGVIKTDEEPILPSVENDEIKTLCSSLLSYSQQNLRVWQNSKIADYDCINLNSLYEKDLNNTNELSLEMREAFLYIADLSVALMSLSQNTQGDIRLHDSHSNWHNVKFFKFEELLP